MDYCPHCGKELPKSGIHFCVFCGRKLEGNKAPAATKEKSASGGKQEIQTSIPRVSDDSASEEGSLSHKAQPTTDAETKILSFTGDIASQSASPLKKEIVIPAFVAAAFIAVAVGAVLGLKSGSDDNQVAIHSSTMGKSATTTKNTSSINKATATTRSTANHNQSYFKSMDQLIAENARLEQQIVSTANEINRVAPDGITDNMLLSISDLEQNFHEIKTKVSSLDPPSSFSQVQKDFTQLVSYNVVRSNSLYRGANAWRNQAGCGSFPCPSFDYKKEFSDGQQAKEAYKVLYPQFEREYSVAKSGV